MKLNDFQVVQPATYHNTAADTLTAAAKLVEALAAMAAQTVKLVEGLTSGRYGVALTCGPAEMSQEQYTKAFQEWASSVAAADIPDSVREKVRAQVGQANAVAGQMNDNLKQVAEVIRPKRMPIIPSPQEVKPAAPGYHDETVRAVVPVLTPVMAANDIPWGYFNVPVADPDSSNPDPNLSVLVFHLPSHTLTPDVVELFDAALKRGGRIGCTMKGATDPTAPPADLRKRPDLYGVPRMDSVAGACAAVKNDLDKPTAARSGEINTTMIYNNIPTTFDPRPPMFPPLPPVAPG